MKILAVSQDISYVWGLHLTGDSNLLREKMAKRKTREGWEKVSVWGWVQGTRPWKQDVRCRLGKSEKFCDRKGTETAVMS